MEGQTDTVWWATKKTKKSDSYSENENVVDLKSQRIEMLQIFQAIQTSFHMKENAPVSILYQSYNVKLL